MSNTRLAILIASTSLLAPAAHAQTSPENDELALLRGQVAALEAQLAAIQTRLEELERAEQTAAVAQTAPVPAEAPAAPAPPAGPQISFAGAPRFTSPGGWSFKPFGRLNLDAGLVDFPDALGRTDGLGSSLRRARLGMEGSIPGGFGYKVEVEFVGGTEVTDAYLTYTDGGLEITAGQHNNFQSMEEVSSSRWSSFMERAAFTDAFGFERRLGLSAQYASGDLIVQTGAFSDNVAGLPSKAWSVDGRLVYAPRVGDTQLHFGGSVHLNNPPSGASVRYRQRPSVNITNERPLATPALPASSEFGLGLETALVSGRFHAAGEAFWQTVNTPGPAADPTFFGGFVEVGYYLTQGDKRGYRGGRWDRTRPSNPVNRGGAGAWQVNLRYDHLDLSDSGVIGGSQDGYMASLVWVPTDYTRLTLNYGHLRYDNAAFALPSGSRSWNADVLALRSQIDF